KWLKAKSGLNGGHCACGTEQPSAARTMSVSSARPCRLSRKRSRSGFQPAECEKSFTIAGLSSRSATECAFMATVPRFRDGTRQKSVKVRLYVWRKGKSIRIVRKILEHSCGFMIYCY